jgi:hypothetical protein
VCNCALISIVDLLSPWSRRGCRHEGPNNYSGVLHRSERACGRRTYKLVTVIPSVSPPAHGHFRRLTKADPQFHAG